VFPYSGTIAGNLHTVRGTGLGVKFWPDEEVSFPWESMQFRQDVEGRDAWPIPAMLAVLADPTVVGSTLPSLEEAQRAIGAHGQQKSLLPFGWDVRPAASRSLGSPLAANAANTELGPGIGTTLMKFLTARFTTL